jgi:uncharacterized membrane protein
VGFSYFRDTTKGGHPAELGKLRLGQGAGWNLRIAIFAPPIPGIIFRFGSAIKLGMGLEQEDTPRDILKKRYAKGEISKEEFGSMMDDIMKS